MNKKLTLLGVILCAALCSAKITLKRSLVVSTEAPLKERIDTINEVEKDFAPVDIPRIYEMRVDTNVSNRYAKTQITSKVKNLDSNSMEATFSIVTPDKAFISGFTMEIDGKKYEAYVQEKEEARNTYHEAVWNGQSAAHVAVSARDSNRFTVSVNMEPQSKATFYLRYEELLVRKNEKYELVLNIHPGQPVKNLEVQVNIAESRPLKFVQVPSLRSGNEISKNKLNVDPEADIKTINETSAIVTFKPDIIKQKLIASLLGNKEENGLSGQFIVQYDVVRDPSGGEVLVDGGYFVHFFAPEDLVPLKKQVVFILDTSGSMGGTKIAQLKEAMNSILDELKPEDVFSIVEFNSLPSVWNIQTMVKPQKNLPQPVEATPQTVEATEDNINHAKKVIQKLYSTGGTDIQSALKVGLEIVAENNYGPKSHQPMIVFLTDGQPIFGETNTVKITSVITELNVYKVPIYSLSFGDGADREFLQKLSLKNQGFARHIYEAADANLQLEDFYQQISSPLLSDVTFKYVDNVKNVTRKHFPIFCKGEELYTTGIITDPEFGTSVIECFGNTATGPIRLQPKVYQAAGSLERLWAYLTVKQLLEQRDVAEDKKGPTQEALRLALKYSFVTDVSSLVVVKPNDTLTVETEDAAKSSSNKVHSYGGWSAGTSNGFPGVPSYHPSTHSRPSGSNGRVGFQNSVPPSSYNPPSYGLIMPIPPAQQRPLSINVDSSYVGSTYTVDNLKSGHISFGNYGFGGGQQRISSGFSGYPGGYDAQLSQPVYGYSPGLNGPPGDSAGFPGASSWYSSKHSQQGHRGLPAGATSRYPGGGYPYDPYPGAPTHKQEPSSTTPKGPPPSPQPIDVLPTKHMMIEPRFKTTDNTPAILTHLPWLRDHLNENNTLTVGSELYELGINAIVFTHPECHNSLNNTDGSCTLLHECPQIYKELTDFETYKKHFCDLNSFAGVCCPHQSTPMPIENFTIDI